MSDPNSVPEWLELVDQHEATATLLATTAATSGQAIFHVGLAVEAALKGLVMKELRLNGWPAPPSRLRTHNLKMLMTEASLTLSPGDPLAPAWAVVLQWDRSQGYDPKPTPLKVSASYIDAAFGADGVVTWIRSKLT